MVNPKHIKVLTKIKPKLSPLLERKRDRKLTDTGLEINLGEEGEGPRGKRETRLSSKIKRGSDKNPIIVLIPDPVITLRLPKKTLSKPRLKLRDRKGNQNSKIITEAQGLSDRMRETVRGQKNEFMRLKTRTRSGKQYKIVESS